MCFIWFHASFSDISVFLLVEDCRAYPLSPFSFLSFLSISWFLPHFRPFPSEQAFSPAFVSPNKILTAADEVQCHHCKMTIYD